MSWEVAFGLGLILFGAILCKISDWMTKRAEKKRDRGWEERREATDEEKKAIGMRMKVILEEAPEFDYGGWKGCHVCVSCEEEIYKNAYYDGNNGVCGHCGHYSGTDDVECIIKVRRRVYSDKMLEGSTVRYTKERWEYKEDKEENRHG